MVRELDYKADCHIDETALDVEWLGQAEMGRKYGRHAAYMRKLAKKAEQRTKVVQAELHREALGDPVATTGKQGPNAGDIDAFVRSHDDHKKAKEEQIEAEYEADYAEYAQKEIAFTRKQTLEHLVALHGQQYFAGPTMPRDLASELDKRRQRQQKTDNGINQALKKKTPKS